MNDIIMDDKNRELKINYLLSIRSAVKNNQVVIIILYDSNNDEYTTVCNNYGIDFDEVLAEFNEMPFVGRISPQDAFDKWGDYYDDPAIAEIYGFELEDGKVQISILDYFIKPPESPEEEYGE